MRAFLVESSKTVKRRRRKSVQEEACRLWDILSKMDESFFLGGPGSLRKLKSNEPIFTRRSRFYHPFHNDRKWIAEGFFLILAATFRLKIRAECNYLHLSLSLFFCVCVCICIKNRARSSKVQPYPEQRELSETAD